MLPNNFRELFESCKPVAFPLIQALGKFPTASQFDTAVINNPKSAIVFSNQTKPKTLEEYEIHLGYKITKSNLKTATHNCLINLSRTERIRPKGFQDISQELLNLDIRHSSSLLSLRTPAERHTPKHFDNGTLLVIVTKAVWKEWKFYDSFEEEKPHTTLHTPAFTGLIVPGQHVHSVETCLMGSIHHVITLYH